MGVAPRRVLDPNGREWQVRVHRFRPPRWRQFEPGFSDDPDIWLFGIDLVVAFVSALAGLVVSLFVLAVELPVNALKALFSEERIVEASSHAPQAIRMRWRTDAVHVDAVADQVARQLELGYERVQPHNAVFEGFGDS